MTIANRVKRILDEAVQRVSDGGKMKFDIRSLFYAVREIFLKRWPGEKFYLYNSFTQDFMRSYERQNGKLEGMVRGPRGKYVAPDETGWRSEDDVKPGVWISRGIGNKILVVEKLGLYEQMKANEFDKRLDCIIMTTQGFTTEAGRDALNQVEEWKIPICVLHDYDVNGILIKQTLVRPTKRLDTAVNPEILVDVGLNLEVIKALREHRDLTPEPVDLGKQDLAKLEGLLNRGDITEDEYEFLRAGRVELNALTPLELLKWLEERLESLGLWKTVPTPDNLEGCLKRAFIEKLASEMAWTVKDLTGYDEVYDLLSKVEDHIRERIKDELEDEELPESWTVEEFKDKMRDNMTDYWTQVARGIAEHMTKKVDAEDRAEEIASRLEELKEHLSKIEEILKEIFTD